MVSFSEARVILSDPELVARRDTYFERMQAIFDTGSDDRDQAFVLYGTGESADVPVGKDYTEQLQQAICGLAEKADAVRDEKVFRPLILSVSAYGVHFIDRMFGVEGYTDYLTSDVGELPIPDLDNDPSWRTITEAIKTVVDMKLTVAVLPQICLSSALNQAMNLYSENFLLAMLDTPAAARRDLRVMTDLICRMTQWYLDNVPPEQLQNPAPSVRCQPPGYGHVDGCSTHLVSAELYRDFIAPLDEEVLSLYPKGGMIHLCGNHVRHIPTWAQMPSVKSIQLSSVANEELEHHVEGLRSDQVIYVGPTKVLPLERIMDATGGYRVILAEDLEEPLPLRRRPKLSPDRASAG